MAADEIHSSLRENFVRIPGEYFIIHTQYIKTINISYLAISESETDPVN